ncbi:MAG TPA: EamA family transporter [Bacillota bacterium]|nr:EamA family transporter [Bacillota bacterium]HPL53422.1 EamA family transporter [Bacillota bacterium]
MYKKYLPFIFVVIAAILWGTIGIYSMHLSSLGFNVLQLVSIRAMFSSAFIFLFLLVKNRNLLKVKLRDIPYFIGTGILSFVFFNWCYFIAIKRTSLSVAAILLYTAPSFVMIFSAFLFKEKITPRKVSALIITFTGCVMVTSSFGDADAAYSALGILAGLGSGFGYALYSIFGRYALRKYNPYTVTLYTFVFASLFLLLTGNIGSTIEMLRRAGGWDYAILLGLLATVLPFLFYTKGMTQLETGQASITATLEPVVATAIGIALFHEPISVIRITGILLVLIAVAALNLQKK